MDCVLAIKKKHMLLQHDSFDLVSPNRQMILQAKLRDKMPHVLRFLGLAAFLSANLDQMAVGESNVFGEMV